MDDAHRHTFMVIPLLLAVTGLAISIQLTRIHVFVHTDPEYHSICALSDGLNCETVAASPYSVFAGLPVSVWGILGYATMTTLALWSWRGRASRAPRGLGFLLLLSAISVVASAILAFVALTRIDSACLFCVLSYIVNIGILGAALIAVSGSRYNGFALLALDVRTITASPVRTLFVSALVLTILAFLYSRVPRYWSTPGWEELPQLASGVDSDGHHWIGAVEPEMSVEEFSDYECPYCRVAHRKLREIAARHPNRVRMIHRHLPLDAACHPALRRPFHPRACEFAEAAECAALQGRFWDMNDALFAIQDDVRSRDVDPTQLAVRLGLDAVAFKRCMADHTTLPRVVADARDAVMRRVNATPTFVLGESLFIGRVPNEEIEERVLRRSADRASPATGIGEP